MSAGNLDPLQTKAAADEIVERAAEQLGELLRLAATRLRPFPPFPGAFFTNAIEAEPDGAADVDRGCVVVCEDGELYELQMGVDLRAPLWAASKMPSRCGRKSSRSSICIRATTSSMPITR